MGADELPALVFLGEGYRGNAGPLEGVAGRKEALPIVEARVDAILFQKPRVVNGMLKTSW